MTLRRDLPRLSLTDAPIGDDNRPTGTSCRPDCRRPTPHQAHCTVCHGTWTSATAFDQHRQDGWCIDPTSLDMVNVRGLWAAPETHEAMRAAGERLAQARAETQ